MSKLITFDFDETIQNKGELVPEIAELMWKHHSAGDEVRVLTTRMDEWVPDVEEFIEAHSLPAIGVWNTNFIWKAEWVEKTKTKIHTHFDNNPTDLVKLARLNLELRPEKLMFIEWSNPVLWGPPVQLSFKIHEFDEAQIEKYSKLRR